MPVSLTAPLGSLERRDNALRITGVLTHLGWRTRKSNGDDGGSRALTEKQISDNVFWVDRAGLQHIDLGRKSDATSYPIFLTVN